MKVIFLDVDGVLNSTRTREAVEGYYFVSDDNIMILKELIDKTGAKIVLSSSWRKGWRFKDGNPSCACLEVRLFNALELKLKEYGIELMSYTGHLWHRGKEIDEWLKNWDGENVESFVILDDMERENFEPNADRLVQTDVSTGLTESHIAQAIELLNESEE